MNYLTSYLPYVSDRNYQRKQIRRRIVLATGFTILAILLLFFWGTNTSAQDKSPNSVTPNSYDSSELKITSDKPIWTSLATPKKTDKTLILAQNTVMQNTDNNVANKEKVTINSQHNQVSALKKTAEVSQTSDQVDNKQSIDEIGAAYNKDLEILLNKAFSN